MENNTRIARSSVMNLYNSALTDLSPHSVGMWLKATTDDEYVVVPKRYLISMCNSFVDIEEGLLTTVEISKEIQEWL